MSRVDSAPAPPESRGLRRQTEDSARPTGRAQARPLVAAGQCPAGGTSSVCRAAPRHILIQSSQGETGIAAVPISQVGTISLRGRDPWQGLVSHGDARPAELATGPVQPQLGHRGPLNSPRDCPVRARDLCPPRPCPRVQPADVSPLGNTTPGTPGPWAEQRSWVSQGSASGRLPEETGCRGRCQGRGSCQGPQAAGARRGLDVAPAASVCKPRARPGRPEALGQDARGPQCPQRKANSRAPEAAAGQGTRGCGPALRLSGSAFCFSPHSPPGS